MDYSEKSSVESLLSFISLDDKINLSIPFKSSEIYSNAIYFGSTNIIKTNNSLTLTNNNEIIFDVNGGTISIPDLKTSKINSIVFNNLLTEIPGSVLVDSLSFNVHPDHSINFDGGIKLKAKGNCAVLSEDTFSTTKIKCDIFTANQANINTINEINTNTITSGSLSSEIATIGGIQISDSSIVSKTTISINDANIPQLSTNKITLKGSFRSFVNTIELHDNRALKFTALDEIYFNSNKISSSGLLVQSSSAVADIGTIRYNPNIDSIEFKSTKGFVNLNHQKDILDLKEDMRILRTQLTELQGIVTAYINAH